MHAIARMAGSRSLTLTRASVCAQFELSCRPWYPAGFNAHHLVSNVLVFAHEHKTPGTHFARTSSAA